MQSSSFPSDKLFSIDVVFLVLRRTESVKTGKEAHVHSYPPKIWLFLFVCFV